MRGARPLPSAIESNASAVVAVEGLDHDGEPSDLAASTAASSLRTSRARGTGSPAS